jgi:hypothetical protein
MSLTSQLQTAITAAHPTWSANQTSLAVAVCTKYCFLDEDNLLSAHARDVGALRAEAPNLALTTRLTAAEVASLATLKSLAAKGVIDFAFHDAETGVSIVQNSH